jgi:hypothetical protein
MDRHDERRDIDIERRDIDINDTDESRSRSQSGDILGLGGSAVPKMPGDPSASSDPESVRRRRERAMEDETPSTHEDPDRQRSGATGIDMGAGGQGTHVSGK